MATEITDEDIATKALEVQSATADGQSFTSRSMEEVIEAQKHLESKDAATRKLGGIRLGKFIHSGARPR